MTRWTLTVPLTLNDGTPTAAEYIADIEEDIADIAGGFTATPGEGAWRSPDGDWYREPVTVYTFDVSHIADGEVRRLAADIAQLLDQEAVYVTRTDDVAAFLIEREAVTV